ncbi:IPT/TIG domain-containing protein [Flavobacterium sp. LHD-85]|uniref:IPT/TIG domain-containing protein n=1 Tax=Flavobacterium sp. LHD-85 TaxID=3071410 RepID=UPI0027E068C0|nr:IPT/TIG domain-containing protein [Flavobacterium sp. LHD-85]MDQ6530227.1 IPT/TIG domain-containing protein [Flavobacterium sp. LHD-85]
MKKRVLLVAMLQLFMVLGGCSSDSGDEATPEPPVVVVKTPKMISYSKNSGEVGETITINGENFPDKVSEIKITFDGVSATIVSSTATEIKFVLPQTEKILPKIILTIQDKEVYNGITNGYGASIAILPARSLTNWVTQENTLKEDGGIPRILVVNDKVIYLNSDRTGARVYRTLDGGVTWNQWAVNGFGAGFYATKNDEGWSHTGFGISKIAKGGYLGIDTFGNFGGAKDIQTPYCLYVDDSMTKGTMVTQFGDVYVTSNGVDFTKAYDAHLDEQGYDRGSANKSIEIDNDHIWIGGQKTVATIKYPYVLFKNNETDGWKEHYLQNEPNSSAVEIAFADKANGFVLISNAAIYKTINGGDTWEKIYSGEKFTKFTFKDANTGWAVLENKIYKTVDGAKTWTLDYTHNQSIKTIVFKDNVVWAISTDKIIKRYL